MSCSQQGSAQAVSKLCAQTAQSSTDLHREFGPQLKVFTIVFFSDFPDAHSQGTGPGPFPIHSGHQKDIASAERTECFPHYDLGMAKWYTTWGSDLLFPFTSPHWPELSHPSEELDPRAYEVQISHRSLTMQLQISLSSRL